MKNLPVLQTGIKGRSYSSGWLRRNFVVVSNRNPMD